MNLDTYYEIEGRDIKIFLELCPRDCTKGRWVAKLIGADAKLWGGSVGWPRYYFDLNSAKSECIAWMKSNGVFLRTSYWKEVEF